jgi:hypothetical protein
MRSELDKYLNRHNAFEAIFGKGPIAMPTNRQECKPLFARLAGDLSPENLCCDGELPAAQVRAKARHLNACWKELEGIFGREVDEGEVWSW